MSPLVKKEIRLLLPAWIAAMLLAIIPIWMVSVWSRFPSVADPYVELALVLGLLILSITSFGQEFSSGTFTLLLSQPIERRRIWSIKTTVLAAAVISVLLIPVIAEEFYSFHPHSHRLGILTILKHAGITVLSAFTLLSSGLWATLLLRRISEAFWVTLLTPVAIMVALYAVHEFFNWSNQTDSVVIPVVLLVYSLAGFVWACRLFLRAQDLQSTGGEIVFPSRKTVARRTAVSNYPRHWLSALAWKELQLQQVNILIAVVVLALHLASVLIRGLHPGFTSRDISGLLGLIWGLWLAMPLLIGSAAVAEERRVGVVESQFCLPVSRRSQFFIKFFTGLILSLVLGGLMPFIIERASDFNGWIFAVAGAIFLISFYASTLLRTTLQAIGLAMVLALVIYFSEVATAANYLAFHQYAPDKIIGLELLKLFLGVPILFLILAGLMYGNFKWPHENWKNWRRNSITVLTGFAIIFVLTNFIYFRAWEFLTPTRPPHGPARLHNSREIKLTGYGTTIYAILPDGRLWAGTLATLVRDRGRYQLEHKLGQAEFIGGSNWVTVATDYYQALGIQSNGTLWNLRRLWDPSRGLGLQTGAFHSVQVGSATNWSQAASGWLGFLLLQKSGTLWIWGTNGYTWPGDSNTIPQKLKLDMATPPACISTKSNWTEVSGSSDRRGAFARNESGDVFELSAGWKRGVTIALLQATNNSSGWVSFASQGWADVGVKTNGELWLSLDNDKFVRGEKIQLEKNSKWLTVTFDYFGGWSIIALRSDGTLWRWSLGYPNLNNPVPGNPVQLGKHSNWIALFQCWGLTFTLAADGGLWTWDEPSSHVWMVPSRKPVYRGNIFIAQ